MSVKTAMKNVFGETGIWKNFIGTAVACSVLGGIGSVFADTLEKQHIPHGLSVYQNLYCDQELQTTLVDLWLLVEAELVSEQLAKRLCVLLDELVFIQQNSLRQNDVLSTDLTLGSRAFHVAGQAKRLVGLLGEYPPVSNSGKDELVQILQDVYEAIEAIMKDAQISMSNTLYGLNSCE
jgi:hypothetical protein